jgi:hypothetical protein
MSLDGTSTLSRAPALAPSVAPEPVGRTTVPATAIPASSDVPQISRASELMSKLSQLSRESPSSFKAVTSSIASALSARQAGEKHELAERATLQSELAEVERASSSSRGTSTLASSFATASTQGSFDGTTASAAISWTESGLAGELTGALAMVNRALGL